MFNIIEDKGTGKMRILFRAEEVLTAVSGVIMYIYWALCVQKRRSGSEPAEDLIRVANFDLEDVNEEMLERNAEENRREYEIPKSIVTSHIESCEVSVMKVFSMLPKTPKSRQRVLYLHGGGYIHQPSVFHWRFLSKLVRETGMEYFMANYP